MSISSTTPCLYPYDRERSCGGVRQYHLDGSLVTMADAPRVAPVNKAPSGLNAGEAVKGDDHSVGFADILDIINPLQHLPVIGWAYRRLTGDTMKPIPSMIGGTLFGGGIGLLSSAVQEVLISQQEQSEQSTQVASASLSPPASEPGNDVPRLQDIAWNDPPATVS